MNFAKTGVSQTLTVNDVNDAANKMQIAPAGAVPPLVMNMINRPNGNTILVGGVKNGNRGAPVMANAPHPRPESVEFAFAESDRRVKIAGVLGTAFGENIVTAIQPHDTFEASVPFTPTHIAGMSHRPGMQFMKDPTPRYDFALGNTQVNTPAQNVARVTVDAAVAEGVPAAVAQSMGYAAKNAVETGHANDAGNAVVRVAAANGIRGNAVNTVAISTMNAVVLNKAGNVGIVNTSVGNGTATTVHA